MISKIAIFLNFQRRKHATLVDRIKNDVTEGTTLSHCDIKGRIVIATRIFEKDEHVLNYTGDIISEKKAQEKHRIYNRNDEDPRNKPVGSFMLHFKFIPTKNKRLKIPLW